MDVPTDFPLKVANQITKFQKAHFELTGYNAWDEHKDFKRDEVKYHAVTSTIMFGVYMERYQVGIVSTYEVTHTTPQSTKTPPTWAYKKALVVWPGGQYPVEMIGQVLLVAKIVATARAMGMDPKEALEQNYKMRQGFIVRSGMANDKGQLAVRWKTVTMKHDKAGHPTGDVKEVSDIRPKDELLGSFDDFEDPDPDPVQPLDSELYVKLLKIKQEAEAKRFARNPQRRYGGYRR